MCQFLAVYQLPLNHFKRRHAEFRICCTAFSALQNHMKKRLKQNFPSRRKFAHNVDQLDSIFKKKFLWIFFRIKNKSYSSL